MNSPVIGGRIVAANRTNLIAFSQIDYLTGMGRLLSIELFERLKPLFGMWRQIIRHLCPSAFSASVGGLFS